jgi:uncharacterized protein (TIGR04222 family)
MTTDEKALWQRIEAFALDEPTAAFPFSHRLARDNGWSQAQAQRVVAEYKRFVLLAMIAGHPVTPSDQVDQAWHLHLTYTRSYWEDFCGKLLPRPLHHEPTRGGSREGRKFDDWYGRTLASYRRCFGSEPPTDIWPPAAIRFGEDVQFVRVNRRRHWIIPRPTRLLAALRPLSRTLPLLALAGCGTAALGGTNPFDFRGPQFLAFFGLLTVGVGLLAEGLRRSLARGGPEAPAALPAYELAMLAGGNPRTVTTALAALLNREEVAISAVTDGPQLVRTNKEPAAEAHPLERAVWEQLRSEGSLTVSNLTGAMTEALVPLRRSLEQRGLLLTPAQAAKVQRWPMLVALTVPAVGLVKIFVGLQRDRPVGFLALATVVTLVLGLIRFSRRATLSRAGGRCIRRARREQAALKAKAGYLRQAHSPLEVALPLSVALFGTAVLASGRLSPLDDAIRRSRAHGTDSGSGGCGTAGDGGGGDSGCGGGGCGGCGGGGD